MRVTGIWVTLGLLALGLALGMYISCCLCEFRLRWIAKANAAFSGIWALVDIYTRFEIQYMVPSINYVCTQGI